MSAYQGYLLNSNKAPKSHASTATTYGVGTTSSYGHCKTIDNLDQSSHTNGYALSAHQGYVLNQSIGDINGRVETLEEGGDVSERINALETNLQNYMTLLNNFANSIDTENDIDLSYFGLSKEDIVEDGTGVLSYTTYNSQSVLSGTVASPNWSGHKLIIEIPDTYNGLPVILG